MSVFLAWSPALGDPGPGPWTEVRVVAEDLWLVHTAEPLSRVFHEIKWSLPDGDPTPPLLVVPVKEAVKLRGLPRGTATWLADRGVRRGDG